MKVLIKNMREEKPKEEWQVKVYRHSSPLGNPFLLELEEERDLVCDKYAKWFWETYDYDSSSSPFIKELTRLLDIRRKYGKVELFCWCHPKRCHAETIKEFLDSIGA
jgi:hypothetical protein